ncbi:MAG: VapC toxin family PIN domain ribonuclease [Bacteroidota bacterium]
MKVLIDTSILFPALTTAHPEHISRLRLLDRIRKEGEVVILNTHLATELYSNLTRYPPHRIHPLIVVEKIRELSQLFTVIDLTFTDYLAALDRCAAKELISGVVFDALHLQAALKAEASVIYTANVKDFIRLLDDDISLEIRSS